MTEVFGLYSNWRKTHRLNLVGIILILEFASNFSRAESSGQITVETSTNLHPTVLFDYWLDQPASASQVLLLVPGINGPGPHMFTPEWKGFASKHHVILLAPTFLTSPEEIKNRRGYYYPEQWSGQATEDALSELGKRENASVDKILIFGFSAGAHFANGFSLWNPERVKAFVAYSAGWWDDPNEKLASVPGLIMCGEADPRYDATWQFMTKALTLNLPWVWRAYSDTGHQITAPVQKMAAAFLGHYADDEPDSPCYGDVQSYQYVSPAEMESIPSQTRIRLPSKAVADQWACEN